MEIRQDIQLLRGLAVLIVVLFHLQTPFFENGFLGVDIFFVISGFLMAKLYDKGTAFDFYKRRINRLFPAYALTVITTLLAGYFILVPVDFTQLFDQSIAATLFSSNVLYWSQNSYFDKSSFNPLLNLWSLAVEVQFYLIVPFLYPVLRRKKWLFYAVFTGSLVACFAVQTISPKTSFFLMPLRIWEFLIGAWVAWNGGAGTSSPNRRSVALQLFLISLLIVLPFVMKLKPDSNATILSGHPALPALVVTALTGLVIRFSVPSGVLSSLVGRVLSKIGDYSYSIYLVHFPAIVLINYTPFDGTKLATESHASFAIALVAIIVLSAISYFFIEKKYSRALNRPVGKVLLILTMLLSAFALSNLNLSKYSPAEKNIFSAWTDRDVYRCGTAFRALNPTATICELEAAQGDRKILLVGNSHADSIKRVFAEQAAQAGFSTYFGVVNDPLTGGGPGADQTIATSIKNRISVLVLHYSNVYKKESNLNEIRRLVDLANKNGIKVFLIGPVPTYDVHIPKAMFSSIAHPEDFSIALRDHVEKTQNYIVFADSLRKMGVTVFDPAPLLCPSEGRCLYSSANSTPFYFDSNHLTLTGARLLRPIFQDLLQQANRAKSPG